MSDGFVAWYRRPMNAADFIDQTEEFGRAGLALIHPARRTAVVLDIDGESVSVSVNQLAELVTRRIGRAITFQWWLSADVNLTCMHGFEPGDREVQRYYLDGLNSTEVDRVCSLLESSFSTNVDASHGLIIDRAGRTVEFDWDQYVWYGSGQPAVTPDRLILRRTSEWLSVELPPGAVAVDLGEHLVEVLGPPQSGPD